MRGVGIEWGTSRRNGVVKYRMRYKDLGGKKQTVFLLIYVLSEISLMSLSKAIGFNVESVTYKNLKFQGT